MGTYLRIRTLGSADREENEKPSTNYPTVDASHSHIKFLIETVISWAFASAYKILHIIGLWEGWGWFVTGVPHPTCNCHLCMLAHEQIPKPFLTFFNADINCMFAPEYKRLHLRGHS